MEDNKTFEQYIPSAEDQEKVSYVYSEIKDMLEVQNQTYREFNDRTLKQFLDDCQKRLNAYVPDRESQGKADWQANFFSKTTRNKTKALIAGIAMNPPEISVTAWNEKGSASMLRAEGMKTMIDASFIEGDNNPQMEMYLDGWNCSCNGTVVKHDTHIKITGTVKIVKDYNPTTGELEIEESEELIEDECAEIEVPVENMLVKDAYIMDIQKQSAIAWVEYIDKDKLDFEWGEFKNYKNVKHGGELVGQEEMQTFFKNEWNERTTDDKYEVIKYYRKYGKEGDIYRVVINGVLVLDAPLLWGRKKKKYPFSKGIFEPFANPNFFWGNSLPNILMGEQDVENAFINSLTDEVYRSVTTPMLVGAINKDYFDLEDENVDSDTRIYVEDVSQVVPMPVKGVSQGDIAMLNIIKGGMEDDTTDKTQGGASGSGSTAREIVIANERAEQIKGLFYIMMTDLWLQKYRIRLINISMNYSDSKIKLVIGEDGQEKTEEVFKIFRLPSAELSTGKIGTKQIEVVGGQEDLSRPYELDVRETQSEIEGAPTEIMQMTKDYLDDYDYMVRIEPDGLYQKSKALKMAMMEEKMRGYATYFPEKFMQNQEEFFKMFAESYGDDPDQFGGGQQQPQDPMAAMMGGGAPQGMPVPAGVGGPSPENESQLGSLPSLPV
jgi:hypothetical protein